MVLRVSEGGCNGRGRLGECGERNQEVPTIRSALRQRCRHILRAVIIV